MLPLDPFDSLWYPSVRTGTPMVPVRPPRHVLFARPRVVPCGLRVHVLILLPVTRSPARCSCLPARYERRDSLACTPITRFTRELRPHAVRGFTLAILDLTVICTPRAHCARMCFLAEERHAHSPVSVSMLPLDPLGLLVYSCARL